MDVDQILSKTSHEVFKGLDYTHYRIIKSIAENGPTNMITLGAEMQKRSAQYSFGRWGVKDRLEGSTRYLGLIPLGYVRNKMKNKKENCYELTLKGLLASLSKVEFQRNYIAIDFKKLLKGKVKEPQIRQWILEFTKYEIALILFANYVQGINWFKFKYLRTYISELKKPRQIIAPYFLNPSILSKEDREIFQFLKKEYLKLYYLIINSKPNIIDENIRKQIDETNKKTGMNVVWITPYDDVLKILREWYVYLNYTEMEEAEEETTEIMLYTLDSDQYDAIGWFKEQTTASRNALAILKMKGFKILDEVREWGTIP